MGGVVKHAPAEAARVTAGGHGRVLHPGVAQGLFLPPLPGVRGLGGVHVAVALGDQQGLVHVRRDLVFGLGPRIIAGVGEVVIGVHILQKMALFQIAHAGGGAAGVQLMGDGVGAAVKFVVVQALVDPHAPENDAGVVPVLEHHLPGVLTGLLLPLFVPDVLPAGDLGEHQQTLTVALVDKIPALGVVGGADGVALQLVPQNPGVLPLQMLRGGVADGGIALVPVQAPEEGLFPV